MIENTSRHSPFNVENYSQMITKYTIFDKLQETTFFILELGKNRQNDESHGNQELSYKRRSGGHQFFLGAYV